MSKKKSIDNSKNSSKTDAPAGRDVAVATRPPMPDLFAPRHLAEWFERWPEVFARRWPESLQGIPFVEAGFRMEQLVDDDGTLVVRGELPGLDPDEDVNISVDGDRLTISGEREERSEESSDASFHSEFRYGSFERSARLPTGARVDDISATYSGGILEVRIPVDGDSEAQTIPIKRGD